VKAYTDAFAKLDETNEYRRLVLAKLNVLGVDPTPAKGAAKLPFALQSSVILDS
jgi:hypothetical protein